MVCVCTCVRARQVCVCVYVWACFLKVDIHHARGAYIFDVFLMEENFFIGFNGRRSVGEGGGGSGEEMLLFREKRAPEEKGNSFFCRRFEAGKRNLYKKSFATFRLLTIFFLLIFLFIALCLPQIE